VPDHPPVTIADSHLRVLHAGSSGRGYHISLAPSSGFDEQPERVWPVIFVLDANLYFGMVADTVRYMNTNVPVCNELPDALVVGIGYPVEGTLRQRLHQVIHRGVRLRPSRDRCRGGVIDLIHKVLDAGRHKAWCKKGRPRRGRGQKPGAVH
jgi:hypothetical protein